MINVYELHSTLFRSLGTDPHGRVVCVAIGTCFDLYGPLGLTHHVLGLRLAAGDRVGAVGQSDTAVVGGHTVVHGAGAQGADIFA